MATTPPSPSPTAAVAALLRTIADTLDPPPDLPRHVSERSSTRKTPDDKLTAPEAAAYLRTSVRTIRRLIASGDVPSILSNRKRFILRGDLDDFVAGGGR